MGKLADRLLGRVKIGTAIERAVKPIARLIRAPCLDADGKLKAGSQCAKMRDRLDRASVDTK